MGSYDEFLQTKMHEGANSGFEPVFMPGVMLPFQAAMVDWAITKGRGALFEDCGLGKTLQAMVWAQNVAQHTNKPVLVLTFLAVAPQFVTEGNKFDIPVYRSSDGGIKGDIIVTNYQKLKFFNPEDFGGVVCDESSILKSLDGAIKDEVTQFMRKVPYRLLDTATAAPNDFIELGTSSEALGYMGYMDMLNKFFKNDLNNSATRRHYGEAPKWRFKGHAELVFWRWVCSWARAMRKPSDLGFSDEGFVLPPLQLDVIDRVVQMRSNPGEVVLTPFMGVGSEVYSAVRMGRRGIGAELKSSYFKQAVKNLEEASLEQREEAPQPDLFEEATA